MTENIKPRLLIMYDYFYPAYKAGGPIQSLTNLVYSLQDDLDIFVLTGAYDLNSDQLPDVVKINGWCDVKLPGSTARIKVWYAGRGGPGAGTIKRIIEDVKPCAVYLNGMFSYRFVLIPLLTIKNTRIILSPRGMLQMGALAGKYLFDALRIDTTQEGWAARGYALGTAAHGIGAARALQVNADAGAYAALALGLQVILASLLMPFLVPLIVRLL